VGLPPQAAGAYLGLFFDVQPRLDSRSYIASQVIGLDPQQIPTPEQLLLLSAHHQGPDVIPPWLHYFKAKGDHFDLKTESGRIQAATQLIVDVHQLGGDASTQSSLMRRQALLCQWDLLSPKSTSVKAAISKNTARMLSEIVWRADVAHGFSAPSHSTTASHPQSPASFRKDAQAG
jgi:hypothetical protein